MIFLTQFAETHNFSLSFYWGPLQYHICGTNYVPNMKKVLFPTKVFREYSIPIVPESTPGFIPKMNVILSSIAVYLNFYTVSTGHKESWRRTGSFYIIRCRRLRGGWFGFLWRIVVFKGVIVGPCTVQGYGCLMLDGPFTSSYGVFLPSGIWLQTWGSRRRGGLVDIQVWTQTVCFLRKNIDFGCCANIWTINQWNAFREAKDAFGTSCLQRLRENLG